MDEKQIIRLAKKGDRDAFEALVKLKRNKVFWVAYQTVGNEEDARDVAQMVFLRLWRVLDRYDEQYAFDTWLHTITVRLAIDSLRRNRKKQTLTTEFDETVPGPPPGGSRNPQTGQERELGIQEVQNIFNTLARYLTERQRSVFVLREMQGLSMKEIAEAVGCRESTVRNHLFQARKVLKEKLVRHYPEYAPARTTGTRDQGA